MSLVRVVVQQIVICEFRKTKLNPNKMIPVGFNFLLKS